MPVHLFKHYLFLKLPWEFKFYFPLFYTVNKSIPAPSNGVEYAFYFCSRRLFLLCVIFTHTCVWVYVLLIFHFLIVACLLLPDIPDGRNIL